MALKIGIQLYSVRKEMQKDPLNTIKKVGDIGYKYLEFANHRFKSDPGCGFGVNKKILKDILDQYHLHVVNCHIADVDMGPDGKEMRIREFEMDDFKRGIEYHQYIGNHNFAFAIDFFTNHKEDILKKCEYYNKVGKICSELGAHMMYHNHFEEFVAFDGETIFDLLVKNTDPAYVSFELDTFWAVRGGENPVELMEKYGKRIRLLHQKDLSKDSKVPANVWNILGPQMRDANIAERPVTLKDFDVIPSTDFVEIGMGSLPIQEYINAARKYTNAEYILLEQDHTLYKSEFDSVRKSMDSFKKFDGIEWN